MDLLDSSNLVATQIFVSALFGNLSFAYLTFFTCFLLYLFFLTFSLLAPCFLIACLAFDSCLSQRF